jgi:hypothetical protein
MAMGVKDRMLFSGYLAKIAWIVYVLSAISLGVIVM